MNLQTAIVLASATALCVTAQESSLKCDNNSSGNSRQVRHCEMREQTVGYAGMLSVDAGQNGGVSLKGWNRGDVLVRMRVEAGAETEQEARSLVSQVRNDFSAGRLSSSGPATTGRNQHWSVSYEVFVPQQANLEARAHNGGVHVSGVTGNIDLTTVNGGVHLAQVGGKVQGRTTNGGVHVQLTGSRWDGEGLDLTTTNGGVHIEMPSQYSANLNASTSNGRIQTDFDVMAKGKIDREINSSIGAGGPPVRVRTTNGAVHLSKI